MISFAILEIGMLKTNQMLIMASMDSPNALLSHVKQAGGNLTLPMQHDMSQWLAVNSCQAAAPG